VAFLAVAWTFPIPDARAQAPGRAEISGNAEWALGTWDGSLVSIGGAGGVTGGSSLNNRPAGVIVSRDAAGTFTCRWSLGTGFFGSTKSCRIGERTISLKTSADADVVLTRSSDSLVGTYRGREDFAAYSQNQVHLKKAAAVAPAETSPSPTRLSDLNGTWRVTQVCPDSGRLKAYAFRFDIEVKDGQLRGHYGPPGQNGSHVYSGTIAPDGALSMKGEALAGPADPQPGLPVSYEVTGRLRARTGTATRTVVRPCDFTFVKT
jgi:hypothetical protein